MSQGKIVLMACGSFSPPTYMHLRMFEIAKDYIHTMGLGTVVGGIVSPVHDKYGKKDLVAAQHRISMLKLSLRSSGWVKVSEWEAQQPEWTRTRVSLQHHQDTINQHLQQDNSFEPPGWLPDDVLNVNSLDEPDAVALHGAPDPVTVKLLCGADLLESFATPGLWSDEDLETLVGAHGLVVVARAGSEPARFLYESDTLYKHRKNVIVVPNYIRNEVSSTAVRRLLRRRESARYLTDDAVLAYARQHRLYTPPTTDTEYTPSPRAPGVFKNVLLSIRDKPRESKRRRGLTASVTPAGGGAGARAAFGDPAHPPGRAVPVVPAVRLAPQVSAGAGTVADGVAGPVSAAVVGPATDRARLSASRKLDVRKSKSEVSKLCERVKGVALEERAGYKTRSCNDIVRLVLTKHGIHVISDTEAIV